MKEKFDNYQEFGRLKELIFECKQLCEDLKKGKLRDQWKKERQTEYYYLKNNDNVYCAYIMQYGDLKDVYNQSHEIYLNDADEKVNSIYLPAYCKSIGYGDYVELRSWLNKDENEITYCLKYFKIDNDRRIEHRLDGPAKFSTKDFKRASCEYYLDGAKVPQYFYQQNFAKIQYMTSIANIVKKKYTNYNVVSKPIEGFIRVQLSEKYIKYEELISFVEDLKKTVSKNFNFSIMSGYDMTLSIRMYMSKDANIENDVTLEKNSDFFN